VDPGRVTHPEVLLGLLMRLRILLTRCPRVPLAPERGLSGTRTADICLRAGLGNGNGRVTRDPPVTMLVQCRRVAANASCAYRLTPDAPLLTAPHCGCCYFARGIAARHTRSRSLLFRAIPGVP